MGQFVFRSTAGVLSAACILAGTIALESATPALGSATAMTAPAAVAPPTVRTGASNPANWSTRRLAAQVVLAGVDMSNLGAAQKWTAAGVGGVVLFGTPTKGTHRSLMRLRSSNGALAPFVSSDEEGGRVQRLARALGRLPSAAAMGSSMSTSQVKRLAARYGKKMRRLGVNMDLAPVADLKVRGKFIARDGRAFASNPGKVGRYVKAWDAGMRSVRVATTVKHWPGHGSSADTHVGSGRTPRWSVVQRRDLLPFLAAFRAGAPAVMVGHLTVPGLTEPGSPASMSPRALRTLRAETGPSTVIMTDSLSMGAVTSALHQSVSTAAIRSLRAGSDIAMVNVGNPMGIVRSLSTAIQSGKLSRARVVASVRRILALKAQLGL